ncbi:hypothetical protein [Streptomyces sp. NPDC048242]|uniref:hypothetical protein n=1 Tax=Streptomyces sp. NPDC048242 TaxID=3155026 RepID=UPI003421333D
MTCTLCKTRLEHGYLCPDCTRDTLDRLQGMAYRWKSLEEWLIPGRAGTAQYGGRVRRAEAPLPLTQEALDLRAGGGIVGVLEDWHAAVCDARSIPLPPRPAAIAARVRHAADRLAAHIHFIVLWEQAGQLAREIRALEARVLEVTDPGRDEDEPTALGRCVAELQDGTVCGARLYADMGRPVQCTHCGCPYPPETWLALRHYQPKPARPRQFEAAAA